MLYSHADDVSKGVYTCSSRDWLWLSLSPPSPSLCLCALSPPSPSLSLCALLPIVLPLRDEDGLVTRSHSSKPLFLVLSFFFRPSSCAKAGAHTPCASVDVSVSVCVKVSIKRERARAFLTTLLLIIFIITSLLFIFNVFKFMNMMLIVKFISIPKPILNNI